MSVSTPNYMTTESIVVGDNKFGSVITLLPANSFVRPIELRWVPKHILEDHKWRFFNKELEVFCYTYYGIIALPKKIIRGA